MITMKKLALVAVLAMLLGGLAASPAGAAIVCKIADDDVVQFCTADSARNLKVWHGSNINANFSQTVVSTSGGNTSTVYDDKENSDDTTGSSTIDIFEDNMLGNTDVAVDSGAGLPAADIFGEVSAGGNDSTQFLTETFADNLLLEAQDDVYVTETETLVGTTGGNTETVFDDKEDGNTLTGPQLIKKVVKRTYGNFTVLIAPIIGL